MMLSRAKVGGAGPWLLAAMLALSVRPAEATWSVVLADELTGEVGVGSVTCLTRLDLRALTPVVLVGRGVAAVQAAGDFDGTRRPIIREELLAGTAPEDILARLATLSGHEARQYGIVDATGRAVSFTGATNGAWAGGTTGAVDGPTGEPGALAFAVQGNVLSGACVVADMEDALRTTPGDLPEKLMAAMRAAREAGGDGRCSCAPDFADGCGCPPDDFAKAGHVGYVIVARRGDVDDTACDAGGCADGTYCLSLNVAGSRETDPDPVEQLQAGFDAWRAGLVGRPDAVRSRAEIRPEGDAYVLSVQLLDWRGEPLATGAASLAVAHESDSAGLTTIGASTAEGDGLFSIPLTPSPGIGVDRFRITADDGVRRAILMPSPELCLGGPCTCDPDDPEAEPPGASSGLRLAGSGLLTWTPAPRAELSNVYRGDLDDLRTERSTASATCFARDLPTASLDASGPPPARASYFLAQGRNGCGDGAVGTTSSGSPRSISPCP